MSKLATLQRDFAAAIQSEDATCGWAAHGMAAYRHTYRAQMLACMAESFPVLATWLGDDAFTAMAIGYALAHPPQGWSLDHFPAQFVDWLTAQAANAVMVDLARIEWALGQCFVAPDEEALTSAAIATTDWDSARLAPIAASRLLQLTTNATDIWLAVQAGDGLPEPTGAEACVLIWRRQEQCHLREVDAIEARLLDGRGFDFAELCAELCDHLGDDEGISRAGSLLAQWAEAGIMVHAEGFHA